MADLLSSKKAQDVIIPCFPLLDWNVLSLNDALLGNTFLILRVGNLLFGFMLFLSRSLLLGK